MALYGINSTSGFYDSLFGTTNTDSSQKDTSSILSGNSLLGDYSMIKSGAYKKLLNSYYASQEQKTSSEKEVDSTTDLLTVKSDASSLSDSLKTLNDKSLYQSTGEDKEGNSTYNREEILKSVKGFVDSYNSYMESSGDVNTQSILGKTLSVVGATSSNGNLLEQAGIKVGSDNKLTLDQDILNKASVSTLSSLFVGNGSYGDRVNQMAQQSYKIANSNAYTNTRAATYTFDGTYSILGTTNGIMDDYM